MSSTSCDGTGSRGTCTGATGTKYNARSGVMEQTQRGKPSTAAGNKNLRYTCSAGETHVILKVDDRARINLGRASVRVSIVYGFGSF